MYHWVPVIVLLCVFTAYELGRRQAAGVLEQSPIRLHSLPKYHGIFSGLCIALPVICVSLLWFCIEPFALRSFIEPEVRAAVGGDGSENALSLAYVQIENIVGGSVAGDAELEAAASKYEAYQSSGRSLLLLILFGVMLGGFWFARARISPAFRARIYVERCVVVLLWLSAFAAVLTTVGIVASLLFESYRFFLLVSPFEFLFGTKWSPQIAIRADQVGSSGAFGAVPLFVGTLLIGAVAMAVALPLGLLSAVYLAEYATKKQRSVLKPLLEVLAGIPTVVYGFFAALVVAPFLKEMGAGVGLTVSSESALAAGLVMGVMIIPFISSLSDDVINAVPQRLRDGSLALGATPAETTLQVVLPAALPGIVGAFLLAVSRALGETMIVVMAAGLAANLTLNPLENVTTVTVQIVTTLVGDQEFESAKTLSAFALGLVLFFVTLVFNVIALQIVKRYREKYE